MFDNKDDRDDDGADPPRGDRRYKLIAEGLLEVLREHDAMTARTANKAWLELIDLAKRYWLLHLAMGVVEEATDDDSAAESALLDVQGDIEAKMIDVAGSAEQYLEFEAWAGGLGIHYGGPPFVTFHPNWEGEQGALHPDWKWISMPPAP